MKLAGKCLRILAGAMLVIASGVASATTVDVTQGYIDATIVRPSSVQVNDYFATSAGTITFTIKDLKWGDVLSALSTSITTFDAQHYQLQGDGVAMFQIGANEHFSTNIYALADGIRKFGLYGVDIGFAPAVGQVPLPAGFWLLLSGAGLLALRARRSQAISALLPA